jgi:uncharacterized delta-60 repeat protein
MSRTPIIGLALAAMLVFSAASAQAKPGQLDPTFGHRGIVTTPIERWATSRAIAVQQDGKIVLAGWSAREPSFGPYRWAFARYKPDGSLDRIFGRRGKVTLELGGYGAYGLALQRDHKIVAVGYAWTGNRWSFALVRLRRNGSRDASFGRNGVVVTDFPSDAGATSVAVRPDGKIVAAGSAGGEFALARYNPDGSLDRSFGSGGVVTSRFPSRAGVAALRVQPDGKIVVVGPLASYDGFALARFLADGRPDPSFGTEGRVVTSIGENSGAFALAVQRDGKIVAGGLARVSPSPFAHFALARYHTNGRLDPGFGDAGAVRIRISREDAISALAIGPRGKIIAAGYSWQNNYGFAVARFKPTGAVDRSFGRDGTRQTQIGGLQDLANSVALQRDGKILVAGMAYTRAHNRFEFALVRYLGDRPICVVPRVKGKKLTQARLRIRHAHCSVGHVKRQFSPTVEKGRVISQQPEPGAKRPAGSKVNLVVSRGKRG